MSVERWLPIPGYEGLYEVSDHGRVKSLDRVDSRGWRRRGALKTQTPNVRDGRPTVRLNQKGRGEQYPVCRLVLAAFVGPCPGDMECCHGDGDNTNNRLENLRWDTRSGNQQDALRHGTHAQAAKTHCKRNHLLAAPNLCRYSVRQGFRACLACNKGRKMIRDGSTLGMQAASDLIYARIMAGEFRQTRAVSR